MDLEFVIAPDGGYLAPRVPVPGAPDIDLGFNNGPSGGFSAHGKLYVFFGTDFRDGPQGAIDGSVCRSVLASTSDGGYTFTHHYEVSRDKFRHVAPWVVEDNAGIPGLPLTTGQGLLLWGSGYFRQSNPYLAYVPLDQVENRTAWRYFAGVQAGAHALSWSTQEADAVPLFTQPVIGEHSVMWNSYLHKWLMLYNAPVPRGINFRAADQPWGPWSPPALLFDPWEDGGYCHFMHVPPDFPLRHCAANDPNPSDPGRENEWGGEYGPYLVAPFTDGDQVRSSTTIYFVMSTANPYQTVLMASNLYLGGHDTFPRHDPPPWNWSDDATLPSRDPPPWRGSTDH